MVFHVRLLDNLQEERSLLLPPPPHPRLLLYSPAAAAAKRGKEAVYTQSWRRYSREMAGRATSARDAQYRDTAQLAAEIDLFKTC